MPAHKSLHDCQVDRSLELYHASRHLLELTQQLLEGSDAALKSSRELLQRTTVPPI